MNRRAFLGSIQVPAAALAARAVAFRGSWPAVLATVADLAPHQGTPAEIARDESFWFPIQQAYPVDRSLVNLNNGGVAPSPAVVLEAMKRHLDVTNQAPAYTLWQLQEPQRETCRKGLAALLGCDPEEVAITRNASESLENLQYGIDLKRGDEVMCCDQDYPRMITTFKQRERREGIVFRTFPIPAPCEDNAKVVAAYEEHMNDRTRLVLVSHVIFMTGAIQPVREIVAAAKRRGIPAIVDGAHAFAHLPFRCDDLGCDNYSSSLHKWLAAPIGTGLLYLKRDRIKDIWPLMAASPEQDGNIRKFEEIGTHPAANTLAIAEALAFHAGIGAERKFARLVYLRDRWASRLAAHDRVKIHTNLKPGFAGAFATVGIDGIKAADLASHLFNRHRIFTVGITHAQFEGLRVSPNVYTTLSEVDRFTDAVEAVLANGLEKA
jgi:selenocysteine lyase/cysteine desulfurase